MRLQQFSKPITAQGLNESLAKKFGTKINLDAFTVEQLEDARNKLRTDLSQYETNESFEQVHNSDTYQKSKLFLDVLNAAIEEKATKPDYIDLDGDGDKKEPMKKAAKDAKKKVKEGAEEEATLVMAAKDMVDRVTGWMEDTAEMQTESMLEIGDKIRDELGSEQSEQFISSVKPALEGLFATLESTREALTGGVAILTGEGAPTMGDDVSAEDPADAVDAEPEMEPTVDAEETADEFGAAQASAGGEEEAGREKRESVESKKKA